jgi:hypothetical protein
MAAAVRALVSQDRIRFRENGFDLDLTYITGQIIGSTHIFRLSGSI